MCLGVPGRVEEVGPAGPDVVMGRVSFGGVVKDVCLAYTPDVRPGDYVIVHVGFAIAVLDEQEAARVFESLAAMDAGSGG
ncbi:MAG TPA: HypC/HybG/HupF family hydrogenase formation chaperone [Longimicrobiales bacterium]|nr:HypC/HybG/HupF family hydrogenase formation chaperone [Longimicrobiales bacterium]